MNKVLLLPYLLVLSSIFSMATNLDDHDNFAMNNVAAKNAQVFFIKPLDGKKFLLKDSDTIEIIFGAKNVFVKPAGELIPNSGHHHLLINVEELPDLSMPIPANDNFIHFGKGQTSTVVSLPKGQHKLQMLLGNHVHIPHNPPVLSDPIYIEVK